MSPWLGLSIWKWANTVLLLALAATTSSAPLAWTFAASNYSRTVAVSRDGRHAAAESIEFKGRPVVFFAVRIVAIG